MQHLRIRRILGTTAIVTVLALPASIALADQPADPGRHGRDRAASQQHERVVSEDEDGDDSNDPDHEFGESRHPSGKDRTDHQDKPQGNAQSDPDDDGIGTDRDGTGEDQPGGDGGVHTDDQDGNNGCGNDQDFEDDNNGWCGRPPSDVDDEPEVEDEPGVDDEPDLSDEVTVDVEDEPDEQTGVLPDVVVEPAPDVVVEPAPDVVVEPAPDTELQPAPEELPQTGSSTMALGLVALVSVALGGRLSRVGR